MTRPLVNQCADAVLSLSVAGLVALFGYMTYKSWKMLYDSEEFSVFLNGHPELRNLG